MLAPFSKKSIEKPKQNKEYNEKICKIRPRRNYWNNRAVSPRKVMRDVKKIPTYLLNISSLLQILKLLFQNLNYTSHTKSKREYVCSLCPVEKQAGAIDCCNGGSG